MSFPSTSLLDAFTGADQNPISTNWSTPATGVGVGSCKRLSNQIAGSVASTSDAWYNVATYGPDCECYVTVTVKTATGDGIGVYGRVQQPSVSAATLDGYLVYASTASGTDTITIYRVDNIALTSLAVASQEFAVGDKIGIEIIGTTINAWYWNGSTWTNVATATDSTYSAAGRLAFRIRGTLGRADDFSGGTITTYIDAATVIGKTTPSTSEITDTVDSNTIGSKTTPDGFEYQNAIFDDAIIASVTSFSGVDVKERFDAATIQNTTALIGVDAGPYRETVTITTVTTPNVTIELQQTISVSLSGTGVVGYPLTATITIGVPTATGDGGSFTGTGTSVGGDTETSYTAPGGYWGPSDNDDGLIV